MDRQLRRYQGRTLNRLLAGMLIVGCIGVSSVLFVRWNMRNAPPPIIGRDCDMVTFGRGPYPLLASDPDEAESCLWQAYTTCQTATLVYTVLGLDTSGTQTITVQSKSGHCAVSDVVQAYSPLTIRNGPTTYTYICSGLSKTADDGLLMIGCGALDNLTLRPRPPEQVGHVCGEVYQDNGEVFGMAPGVGTSLPVSQIEECFWRRYQTCTSATLLYTVVYRSIFTRTFTVQPSESACKISDSSRQASKTPNTSVLTTVACAGMEQRDGGLLFSGCGSDGTIFVPPGKSPATPSAQPKAGHL